MISCTCGYRGVGIADGATIVCPICRTPVATAPSAPAPAAPPPQTPWFPPPAPAPAPVGGLRMPPPPGALPVAAPPARPPVAAPPQAGSPFEFTAPGAGPVLPGAADRGSSVAVRIPCPNGHVLKTNRSMLGQQVVCPTCNQFFVLEETESLEYKQEAARRRAHEDEERAQKWLWRAIYSAIFIVLSFIVMAVIGSNPQWLR